jgi:hypothetical protein
VGVFEILLLKIYDNKSLKQTAFFFPITAFFTSKKKTIKDLKKKITVNFFLLVWRGRSFPFLLD